MVSTDCAARRCGAGHELAGIAIATMTSLRHRPTTDNETDIATLMTCLGGGMHCPSASSLLLVLLRIINNMCMI